MVKVDTSKIVNTAITAFVSASFGALGSYVMNKTLKSVANKPAANAEKKNITIGFDMRG